MKMMFCHHLPRQWLRRARFNQDYSRRPTIRRGALTAPVTRRQEAFPSQALRLWHSTTRISTKWTTTPRRNARQLRLDHVHVIVLCVWWCVFSAKLHLQDESVSPVSSTPEQCSSRTSSVAALASRETRPIWWSLRCQEEWRRPCRMLQVRSKDVRLWKLQEQFWIFFVINHKV